ncbi:helix-turn-helix transcriptional regulator [Candidatus Peregrinibacteria bacterium]|nr:helix-turn-helix transcriptional regulator [Candidatus Peregrinibacteria bacterium]
MNSNYSKFISDKILSALKERNVSQTELAQMIEKSRAYISNIIRGRYLPKISELIKIAEYLKKPISYFLGEESADVNKFSEKAKKWDTLVSMLEKEIKKDFKEDIITIPLLDNSKLRNRTYNELLELKSSASQFIYLARSYVTDTFYYHNNLDNAAAVRIFIRSYPEFGIEIGDIAVFDPVINNDIGDFSGKLFAIFYKGDLGIKRIYKEGKFYYFEPMHSSPVIDKIRFDDPNLVIPGRVIFVIHTKMF